MPARLRDVARAVEAVGGRVERPNKGSHWKAYSKDGRLYPLPAHNGERSELDDNYIRGLCRHLGITVEELLKHV